MGDPLTIRVRSEQDHAIATVAGEIDITTVIQLRDRLFELADSRRNLVIDLDQITFIDATGLNALAAAANRAATHDSCLQVVCARPWVRELFRLAGLDSRIPLAHTLDEARETLAATTHPHPDAGIVAPDRPDQCGIPRR